MGDQRTLGELVTAPNTADLASLAVVDDTGEVSYGELVERSMRFADGLAATGVGAGDIVLIQLPNWWEAIVAMYGTWLRGAVACPVVSIYREHELDFIVRQTRPAVVVAPEEYRECAHIDMVRGVCERADVPAVFVAVRGDGSGSFDEFGSPTPRVDPHPSAPSDRAVVLYTSGTTSDPKGAIHSHETLLYEARSIARLARLTVDDPVFMPSPLTHITGLLYGAIMPIDLGAPSVLMARWDPADARELIEARGCTFSVGATPFLRGLTDEYESTGGASSVRVYVCGGADVPPDLVRRSRAVMGARVVRTYGSTEMPTATMTDPYDDDLLPTAAAESDGRAIGDVALRIADPTDGVGELEVKGPELFLGYLDAGLDGEAFTPDGYFRTGDLATIADDGTVTIRGRIKDVINRGGEKFSAKDVEEVLLRHPSVAEVAVVGVPDPALVERACAFVVTRPGETPTLADLRTFLVEQGLPVQKSPEHLRLVAALEKTASGKVQKFLLRQQFDESQ